MSIFNNWFDRLLGRTPPDAPTLRDLKRQQEGVLSEQRDKIRVEIITEVRGQMNKVFGVVDELKARVDTLSKENLELKKTVADVNNTLSQTNNKLTRLTDTVTRNAATAAQGMRVISRQIVGIGGPQTSLSVDHPEDSKTLGTAAP